MKLKLLLCILGILGITGILVSAFSTVEITAPTAFSYHTTLGVNVSGGINVSGFPYLMIVDNASSWRANMSRHILNVTVLNCTLGTNSTCTYGILAASLSLTVNATNDSASAANFWNYTATLTEGRHKIRLNFTNVSRADDGSFGGALSAERIVQIDVEYDIINVGGYGSINMSPTAGSINVSGTISTPLLALQNQTQITGTCTASEAGQMKYNASGTANTIIWCNGAVWVTI